MVSIKIQISANEGSAAWDFPMKDSELADKLKSIGSGNKVPSSGIIWPKGLGMLRGLAVSMDELNFLAKSLERLNDSEYSQFMAAASLEKSPDLERLINLSFNVSRYTVIRDVSDWTGIGKRHLLNIKGSLSKAELETIDFTQVGRDLLSSGRGIPTEYGLLFENEEVPFQQVYDGTVFPLMDREDAIAVVHMHYMEKTEYLYLPEEDISINKALKRLEAPCRSDCTMEIELLSYEDEIWLDILQQVFDQAGLEDANTLAGVLSRKDLDAHSLLYIADYAETLEADEIRKLADHFHDFIIMDGAETCADVGEYITQHEPGYQIGEYIEDFVDFNKLGKYIVDERDGKFMGSCFICMKDNCDLEQIMWNAPEGIEFGGM